MGGIFKNANIVKPRAHTARQFNYLKVKKTDRKRVVKHEKLLQDQVCDWLRDNLPNVHFRSDTGSGAFNSQYQKAEHSKQQSAKGLPDLEIFAARRGFHMLMLELKKDGEHLKKQRDGTKVLIRKTNGKIIERDYKIRLKGDWKNLHVERQAMRIEELRKDGYCAGFAVGYKETIKIICWYFDIPIPPEPVNLF